MEDIFTKEFAGTGEAAQRGCDVMLNLQAVNMIWGETQERDMVWENEH